MTLNLLVICGFWKRQCEWTISYGDWSWWGQHQGPAWAERPAWGPMTGKRRSQMSTSTFSFQILGTFYKTDPRFCSLRKYWFAYLFILNTLLYIHVLFTHSINIYFLSPRCMLPAPGRWPLEADSLMEETELNGVQYNATDAVPQEVNAQNEPREKPLEVGCMC